MTAAHDLAAGAVLQGRYKIVSALGAGGFGAVYKAIQLATNQPVAIKVMHPSDDEPEARRENRVARFRREMDLCARLQHPNIVGLVDSGQTEDGRLFAVFQFASGRGLDQVITEEGALDPREARYLMAQVLDALSCAHNLGVVHRDLKPANLMIVSTGTRRNALVLDFGIGAMAKDANDTTYAKLTSQHEWLGTPHYAAPEQIRGSPPTPASDIYSWGLVYLECLTGQPVIPGSPMVAMMIHVGPDPIPIPRHLRHHRLGRLIQRAVIKEVSDRTATAASLLRELDNCDVSDLERPGELSGPTTIAGGAGATVAPPRTTTPERLERAISPRSSGTPGGAGTASRLVDAERRQITAVCCALAPSAEIELDELELLLGALQEICGEIGDRFGGQLAGGLGHQVLIEFGYPTAREDDVVRAARAAIAIRAAIAEHNAAVAAVRRLEIRIGIHTGMIAYGSYEPDRRISGQILGMTPMIASQLSATAEAGAIVASAATARALRVQIVMTPIGAQILGGVGKPVEVFRIESERAAPTMIGAREGEAPPPLIGREREVALLLERWQAVAEGAGHCVLITGEAGIGKSRLAVELGRRIGPAGHTWLEARCTLETRNRVLHPILEILERVLGLADVEPAARLARIEATLIGFGFRPGDAVPVVAGLLAVPLGDRYPAVELSPLRRRELIQHVIVSLLVELSERLPVILFVEDLHWADPTTLEILGALVAAIPSTRILAVLSARTEFTPPWPAAGIDLIQLSRLPRAQIEQIVKQLTGGKALPGSVLEQMVARTDGVPLFVEELTRMVIESGALTARGDHYELTGALSEVEVPATLRALLTARLDRLGRAKQTAQLAAAIGREFDLPLLTAIAALEEVEVQEDLEKLAEADLVHHKRRLRNPTWLFRHALIRDTAYDSMPRRVQQKVHARIAEVLEQQFAELVAARPDLLAMHHAAAGQKAQAIKYAQQAAHAALAGSAFANAIRHVREAIGWLDALPDARPRTDSDSPLAPQLPQALQTRQTPQTQALPAFDRVEAELGLRVTLGVPLMMTQGFASKEVEANYLRALELCRLAGDRAVGWQFPALWGVWTYRIVSGDHPGGEEAAARLTELGERTGDTSIRLAALTAHGTAVMMRARYAEARRAFEDALAIYDRSAHAGLALLFGQDAGAMCASFLTWVHGHDGERALAESRAAESLAMCDALGQPSTRAFVETVLATWRCVAGDFAEAERHSDAVIVLAAEQGMPHWDAQAKITRGWAIAGRGRAEEGAAIARAGIEALLGIGSRATMSFYWGGLAEAELAAGRIERAAEAIDEAGRYMAKSDERIHEAGLALVEAKIAAAAGRPADADAAITRAIALAERRGAAEVVRRAAELRAQLGRA